MKTTPQKQSESSFKFRQTKIIATVSHSTCSYEATLDLIKAGANGLRLNFRHGTYEDRKKQIAWIRKAAKECGKSVAIIQDLQGPSMRLGDFEAIINVHTGQNLVFGYKADYERSNIIPTQHDLSKHVKRGQRMFIYDGKIRTIITSVIDGVIHAQAENDGILISRSGVNLPDTDFEGDIITAKDRKDIAFGSTQDIDYVTLGSVQTLQDIGKLRGILKNYGSTVHIIAKIETKSAMDNIESIVQEADAVMVECDDLAIETSPESVPIILSDAISLGMHYAKPTIVATQMLATTIGQPEPTRAEVTDIATAVLLGADCVMLGDETANGRYPLEALRIMKRVILHTEANNTNILYRPELPLNCTRQEAISGAIIELARDVGAQAIVSETKSGSAALRIAARRCEIPQIAVASEARVAQQLAIVYGTKSYVRPADPNATTKLTNWLTGNKVLKKGEVVVTASGQYPGVVGTTDTIKVRIL